MEKEEILKLAESNYPMPENLTVYNWDDDAICKDKREAFVKGFEVAQNIVHAVYEGAAQWQQEYNDCRAILKELVELKQVKDAYGKTEKYIERKEKAWQKAIRFLEQYQHQ